MIRSTLTEIADKHLLALRCLLASNAIDPADPILHEQLIRFRHALASLPEQLPPKVAEIIESELSPLLAQDVDLLKANDEFLSRNRGSIAHVQAAMRARRSISPDHAEQDQKDLLATLDLDGTSLDHVVNGLNMLREWQTKPEAISEYIQRAGERWPQATVFQGKR